MPYTIRGIPKTIMATIKAYRLVSKIKPDIVVSFGGYISVPVIFSAFLHRIPSVTHEQTLTNSLSTKINSFFVSKIALSFSNPDQMRQLPSDKIVITGNLLRLEIFKKTSPAYDQLTSQLSKLPLIYITGGSQGSQFLNQIIFNLLPLLTNKYTIIHHAGKDNFSTFQVDSKRYPNYHVTDYVGQNDIGWVLNHASLIISRAGANTCQEIVALHKKAIFVPLPFSQQNEQQLNALWVKKLQPGITSIFEQSQLTPELLLTKISSMTATKVKSNTSSNHQNIRLLQLIHELL